MSSTARRLASTVAFALLLALVACHSDHELRHEPLPPASGESGGPVVATGPATQASTDRVWMLDRVDDVAIVQVYADGFGRLTPKEKELVWHLYQAALAGREIFLMQKCAEGLDIRDLMEEILTHPRGVDADALAEVRRYTMLFWVNNSPYNALTARKNVLRTSPAALLEAARAAERAGARLPKREGESTDSLVARLAPMLFDPEWKKMVTAKNPEGGQDILEASAATFYGAGVTMAALEGFREQHELNSTVVKGPDGKLRELVWRAGDPERGIQPGLYAKQIEAVIGHLKEASKVAPPATSKALDALIRAYRSGEEKDLRAYDVAWVEDDSSPVDTVNGFVEVYVDPRGKKGSWEGIVSYEDPAKARLIKTVSDNAQWFENHMPYDDAYRKPEVKGISARSIDVVIEVGDSGPVTPIGINLPNDQKVREEHGSKSVSLANIIEAYARSGARGSLSEFCWDDAEYQRSRKWGPLAQDLLVNMHEVIGHASGRQAPGREGDPATWIKENYSALEEGRADLVALYFMMDPKLEELGLIENAREAAITAYESYVRNGGMMQLRRMAHGDQLEEDHMRNRQMVVHWIMKNSDAVERVTRDGKTYLRVRDPEAFRDAVGRLLKVVQRIKSTGDYAAAKALFDDYGIKFDPKLRDEVMERFVELDVPSYSGFVFPRLSAVHGADGSIIDVQISYPLSIEQQMLEWSGRRQAP